MTSPQPQPLQASAVEIAGQAVLILGKPCSGKSTLAMALIDRGARLIGDDGVMIFARDERVWVEPHPNIAGKIEVRGVGIVELPVATAPAALIIDLDEKSERLPEKVASRILLGCEIPALGLGGSDSASLPLRVEWGLREHGLSKAKE